MIHDLFLVIIFGLQVTYIALLYMYVALQFSPFSKVSNENKKL